MKKAIAIAIAAALILSLATCSGISSEQYDSAVNDRDTIIAQLNLAQTDLSGKDNLITDLQNQYNTVVSERDSALEQIEQAESILTEKNAQLSEFQAQVDELTALYQKHIDLADSEIRAQAEAENRSNALIFRYGNGVTYYDLMSNPDYYEGERVMFTGYVTQVDQIDDVTTGFTFSFGNANTSNLGNVYAFYNMFQTGYDPQIPSPAIVSGEKYTIYGVFDGVFDFGGISPELWISVEILDWAE